MRSKSEAVDVCAICQKFGGGGHTLAAGARVRGTLAEVEERVLEAICDVVKPQLLTAFCSSTKRQA